MTVKELQLFYTEQQRQQFKTGDLFDRWMSRYPEIFDEVDVRIIGNQRCYPNGNGYHFFECLTAVVLYETCGYLSLLEKYETQSHARKVKLFKETVPTAIAQYVLANRAGAPDLFVYHPETRDWFFCEVKGGRDKLGPKQVAFMTFMRENGYGEHVTVASVSPHGCTVEAHRKVPALG